MGGNSIFSVFTTTKEDLVGQPLYDRFVTVNCMKAVPPPFTGNYMPTSNSYDNDESHMTCGTKTNDSTKIKSKSKSHITTFDSFLSDFSDRSSISYLFEYHSCDSSVKISSPNNNDQSSEVTGVFTPTEDDAVIDEVFKEGVLFSVSV